MNNWSLCTDVSCFLIKTGNSEKIYLFSENKKGSKAGVFKLVKEEIKKIEKNTLNFGLMYRVITGLSPTFKMKFEDDQLNPSVSNALLPEPNKYYEVGNFLKSEEISKEEYFSSISYLLKSFPNNKLDFGELEFEPVLSNYYRESVFFVNKDTPEYDICFNEMKREVAFSLYGKNKKWKLGHQYFSETDSYVVLAEVCCRVSDAGYTWFSENDMESGYLVTKRLSLSKYKKVSEFLKDTHWGEDDGVYVIQKSTLLVDSGEVITPDVEDIRDYWDSIVEKTLQRNLSKIGQFNYNNSLSKLIKLFSYQSKDKTAVLLSPKTKQAIEKALEENVRIFLYTKGGVRLNYRYGCLLENQIETDKSIVLEFLYKKFYNSIDVSKNLFNLISIDVEKLVEQELINVVKIDKNTSFDDYEKYVPLWINETTKNMLYTFDQRVKSSLYSSNVEKVSTKFGENSELTTTLREIVSAAKSGFGENVSGFKLINAGTVRNKKLYYQINISLEDIVKWKKGASNMSENLKKEIVKNQVGYICISIDEDEELK